MNRIKKIFILIIIITITLTFYISKTYTLNNSYLKLINILTFKFNNNNLEVFKIDLLSLYLNKFKNKINYPTTIVFNEIKPLIYIYNTHSNEEYLNLNSNITNLNLNVKTASYFLESELNKLGLKTIVEEEDTITILNNKNLKYYKSYSISRELMENAYLKYPSLEYFIDIHRDSVKGEFTTITIDDVTYAKTLFVLGLENENYLENKAFMEKINNYLDLNYPGLSRGIYEKQGKSVNGVYNQDFSAKTILLEIGGVDNQALEVSNTTKVIAKALENVIKST